MVSLPTVTEALDVTRRALRGDLDGVDVQQAWPSDAAGDVLLELVFDAVYDAAGHQPGNWRGDTDEDAWKSSRSYREALVGEAVLEAVVAGTDAETALAAFRAVVRQLPREADVDKIRRLVRGRIE